MSHRTEKPIPPDTFETPTIYGKKPVLEDASAIFETYATDPEVTRFLVFKPYKQIEDLKTWLSYIIKEWEKNPNTRFAGLRPLRD